jgi:hypothetical protein
MTLGGRQGSDSSVTRDAAPVVAAEAAGSIYRAALAVPKQFAENTIRANHEGFINKAIGSIPAVRKRNREARILVDLPVR